MCTDSEIKRMKATRVRRARRPLAAAALVTAGLLGAGPALVVAETGVAMITVDTQTVAKGFPVTKLRGATVVNDRDEKIGRIDDLIIGLDRVVFAVIRVGGFHGIGGHRVAVPYDSLQLDDARKKIVLPGATKDQLKELPEFKYVS
jgi:hypothetical protein